MPNLRTKFLIVPRFLAGKPDLAQAPMEIGRHHIAVLRCDPDNIADPNGSPFVCNRSLATATRKIVYRLHSLTEGLNIASRQLTYVGHQSISRFQSAQVVPTP